MPILDKTGVLKSLPKYKMILDSRSYRMAHPIYKTWEIEKLTIYHHDPKNWKDKLANYMIKFLRRSVDLVTRYNPEKMDERDWLNRIIFLESVAGVPGMIGGMQRHLKSLRTLEPDNGWIHHLLLEAENERMHLFIFLTIRNNGAILRMLIALA